MRLCRKMSPLLIIVTLLVIFCGATSAQPPTFVAWVDKPQYVGGEQGTLYFSYFNKGDVNVTVETVKIDFEEWHAYIDGVWQGNLTIPTNQTIPPHTTFSNSTIFNVPSDSRAATTSVIVTAETIDASSAEYSFKVNVQPTSRYNEQTIVILTIMTIMVILVGIVIAATIFLTSRRPSNAWSNQ